MLALAQQLVGSPSIGAALLLFIFGACVGSFVNVVIWRLPQQLAYQWRQDCRDHLAPEIDAGAPPPGLIRPRSHCPHCKSNIRARHNIPLLSYFWLRGKCADCAARISGQYPCVEFLFALVTLHAGFAFGVNFMLLIALPFIWALLTLAAIDARRHLLPDNITLPLLWFGLLVNTFDAFVRIEEAVLGAIVGYLALWLLYQVHRRLTGREGMGYGDFKLFAAIGAWLGWQSLPLVALLASLGGTLFALALLPGRKRWQHLRHLQIAFGPFLAFGAWAVFFLGDDITRALGVLLARI